MDPSVRAEGFRREEKEHPRATGAQDRSSSASLRQAREESDIAVSVGFFSGPVVKQLESTTRTPGARCRRFQPSRSPYVGDACMRMLPPKWTAGPGALSSQSFMRGE